MFVGKLGTFVALGVRGRFFEGGKNKKAFLSNYHLSDNV
jgi:hypothetical protein